MMLEYLSGQFPQLTDRQLIQFENLLPLYEDWNAKINVISRKDMGEFRVRHVLHSLAIAKVCDFSGGGQAASGAMKNTTENLQGRGNGIAENVVVNSVNNAAKKPVRVLDVGTGGGFPAIPLAIMFPEVQFTAVDSIGKKIRVVQEVAAAVGLQNLTAVNGRAEAVTGCFDYVVSRAVAPAERLLEWVWAKIERGQAGSIPNGVLLLKGGDLTAELAEMGRPAQVFDIQQWFGDDFFATKKVVYIKK